MNDRELLEMAAKAAGIKGEWSDLGQCIVITEIGMSWEHWRPLDDDGDALRLAVRLDIDICLEASGVVLAGKSIRGSWHASEPDSPDKLLATRRAIVRAAAEIGKAM